MKKFKSLHKIILLILSLLLGFLAVELILRVAKVEYPVFQTFDVNRGFSLRPNTSGWWTREGKAFVKINSDGLRDKEYSKNKKSNIIRIVLLGDSFAEARSIKLERTFWSLLEKNLNTCKKDKQKKVEIINFGVTEYGTTQQYLTLIHHAWDYDPDIIILAFFRRNDIANNSKFLSKKKYRPYFYF
jgi:GDSL-like Lipase/Acylhydrolase.